MSHHPEQAQQQGGTRRRLHWPRRILVTLLLAFVIALVVYLPMAPWSLRWSHLESLLPWLLTPSTGVLSMVLVLLILFWVPSLLRSLTGGAQQPRPEPARGGAAEAASPVERADVRGDEEEQLSIPAMSFRRMGAEHRWELAEALDIPWRDELIHDHQSWAIACLEAAQHRAEKPFS